MSEIRERFLDSAVEAFGNDLEKKFAARAWLGEQVAASDERDLAAAADRWDTLRAKRWWKHREAAALISWALLCLFMILPFYLLLRETEELDPSYDGRGRFGFGRDLEDWGSGYLPQGAKPFLFNTSYASSRQRAERLWLSDQGNPAYFAEYACAGRDALPADFFATAAKLDPENAWFDQFAAACGSSRIFKKSYKTRKVTGPGGKEIWESGWDILDQRGFDEALDILRRAKDKDRYHNYASDMFRERLAYFHPPQDARERLAQLYFLQSYASPEYGPGRLPDLLAAHAWVLGTKGDVEGFKELLGIFECIMEQRLRGAESDKQREIVSWRFIERTAPELQKAALKLDLPVEARRLGMLVDGFRNRRSGVSSDSPWFRHSGSFAGILISFPAAIRKNPPPLSEVDLRPGRLAEHDQLVRSHSILLWAFLGICSLLVFAYRFRSREFIRVTAARVGDLLNVLDWAWIAGGGIVLPMGMFIAALLLTPLGGREQGVHALRWFLEMPGMTARFAVFAALLLILPFLVARWRLDRRIPMSGGNKVSRSGWLAAGCLVILLGISGFDAKSWLDGWVRDLFLRWMDARSLRDEWQQRLRWLDLDWSRILLAAIPCLWLLLVIGRAIFSPSRMLLPKVVMSRVLVKAYASAMPCTMMVVGGFHLSQQYWFERDDLMRLDPARPDFPPYNHRAAEQMRSDLVELWDRR